MNPDLTMEHELLSSRILEDLQSLTGDLAEATAAIARNEVDCLEDCVEAQQTLCAQLLSLQKDFHILRSDPEAQRRLTEVLQVLRREIQSYSKLLGASDSSVRIMLALCNTYKDANQPAGIQQETHGVSCEV